MRSKTLILAGCLALATCVALGARNGRWRRHHHRGVPVAHQHSRTTERRQPVRTAFKSHRDNNTIEGRVTIHRPVEEVFKFYRDFRNLPRFLGDVMNVEPLDPSTSRWTIQGPFGIRVRWTIRLLEERPNELIRYETVTAGGLGTRWEIHFAAGAEAGETEVHEVMKSPLGPLGKLLLALIGKFPAHEVSANLHRLKEVMETGRVTDTSYSVRGKFAPR